MDDMEELEEKLHVCGSCYHIFDSEVLLTIHSQQCGGQLEQSPVQTNDGVLDIKTEHHEEKPQIHKLGYEFEHVHTDHKLTGNWRKCHDANNRKDTKMGPDLIDGESKPDNGDSNDGVKISNEYTDELIESDAANPEDGDHSRGKPHICDQCGKSFRYKSRLIRHLVVHRSMVAKRSMRKYTHKCEQCDKAFTQKSNLDRHKFTHTGERPHKCHQCEKTFRYKDNLENHLFIHTGEKPYQCEQCDKSFTRRFTLNQHLRTHTGEKPYQCGICGKKFRQGPCLWTHMQLHTGERTDTGKKPHQCDKCGKRFKQRCRLKPHTWTHTGGPKPYKCDECGKTFNYKQSLKDHSRIHGAENQYKCTQCGECFARETNLERHRNTSQYNTTH